MSKLFWPMELIPTVKEIAVDTISKIVYEHYSSKDNERTIGMVEGACRVTEDIEAYFNSFKEEETNSNDSGT